MDIVAGQECSASILGDDMMTEILVRLPPESIFRYRSVSKQWNSLLTSPEFLSHYASCFHHKQRIRSPHHLLGFFLNREFWPPDRPRMPFVSTLPRIGHHHGPKHGEIFSSDLGYFITSSNGLVLCGCDPKSYHVLNPVTRKHVSLPPPSKYHRTLSIGLSCDDDGDDLTPRYEVVLADVPYNSDINNKLCIETYSSQTKEWRESVLVGTSDFEVLRFYPPTVVNGVFYWRASGCCLAVYDPHNKQRGNKDRNHVQLIQLPTNPVAGWLASHVVNQTPDERLIYGTTSEGLIEIWELPKRELGFWRATTITEQEWVSIHVVSIQTVCPRNPFIRNEQRAQSAIKLRVEEMSSCKISFDLVDLIPWNPLLLMVRLGRSIFLYHMETQVSKRILFPPEYVGQGGHPFYEPTSFSSYLLA